MTRAILDVLQKCTLKGICIFNLGFPKIPLPKKLNLPNLAKTLTFYTRYIRLSPTCA